MTRRIFLHQPVHSAASDIHLRGSPSFTSVYPSIPQENHITFERFRKCCAVSPAVADRITPLSGRRPPVTRLLSTVSLGLCDLKITHHLCHLFQSRSSGWTLDHASWGCSFRGSNGSSSFLAMIGPTVDEPSSLHSRRLSKRPQTLYHGPLFTTAQSVVNLSSVSSRRPTCSRSRTFTALMNNMTRLV